MEELQAIFANSQHLYWITDEAAAPIIENFSLKLWNTSTRFTQKIHIIRGIMLHLDDTSMLNLAFDIYIATSFEQSSDPN